MPNSSYAENRTEAARALVEHLRKNPSEAHGDPAALAERFGLQPEFVRRALVRLPESAKSDLPRGPHPLLQHADGLAALLDGILERASVNPIRFEAVSLLTMVAIMTLLSWTIPSAPDGEVGLKGALSILVILGTVVTQMAVFYRRRMVRFALYGGLLFGVGTAIPTMVLIWIGLQNGTVTQSGDEVGQGLIVFLVGFAMMIVGAMYAGLAALASVAGGWMHLKREEQHWEQLSRQQLLERYFELQRRLERSVAAPDVPQAWEQWPIVRAVRHHPLFAAGLLGVTTGLLDIALTAGFGIRAGQNATNEALELLSLVEALVSYTLLVVAAFLSGRATRGAMVGAAYVAGGFLASMLPVNGFGPSYALSSDHVFFQMGVLALTVFIGALAGVGATIQRRATREGRLMRNDGATLVAEMLEIQWRLEEDATSVTVMVVDAAKSTAMKVGADPLDVEYSFREYQNWIRECCAGFGGRVHSVAGDGAVVAFPDAASALGAARRIQTDVVRFNNAANRLPKPFRLRLGLHAGQVAGDLNDVQFTEVIDIAAHVENISPVGGIAATEAVVSHLGYDGFLPLAREIDGQGVYIALVPTEA